MPPKLGKKKAQKGLHRKDLKKSRGGLQGSAMVSKPGSEVVIAFESGSPSAPVVIGSLWTSSQAPPVQGKS